jgi:hypothetical protein
MLARPNPEFDASCGFADTLPLSQDELPVEDVACGMPADRAARLAARRTFVEMKQVFLRAVATVSGHKGEWLQQQVRQAREPQDLWLMRGAVISALCVQDGNTRNLRAELFACLDRIVPVLQDKVSMATPAPWMAPNRAGYQHSRMG